MVKKTKKGKDRLDKYYHLAKDQGYRSRACFKLIQLAKKFDFLSKSRICIDLCAAPGGWSQVAVQNMPAGSQILAIDLVPIKPIPGVTCIQSDITTDKCRTIVRKELKGEKADVVLNDGAPNVGANWQKDAFGQCELTLQACRIACEHLKVGGCFVTKVFRSADYNSLLWVFNQLFKKVDATKPTASRNVSAEIFVLCSGYKGGKVDQRFFDPKFVFMETVEPEDDKKEKKGPGASLGDLVKNQSKRHRDGYEWGDDLKILPAHEFVNSKRPAEILVTHHRLSLDAPGSEELRDHELTTDEIRELCADLKLLGKRDLSQLMKWRMKILRGRERADKKAKKEAMAAAVPKGSEAGEDSKKEVPKGALEQDVDDAISQFLKEGEEPPVKNKQEDDSESEVDEELERDLAEQVAKKRREERLELKKTMARQRKMEWKKKLSLGGGKEQENQKEEELFKINARNVQALEDEDKYIVPHDSAAEEESGEEPVIPESDSDDELDRITRMEVDLAVRHELSKARFEATRRNKAQRLQKHKKETRRQRMIAAWSGEFAQFNQALDEKAKALRDAEPGSDDDDDDELDADELQNLRKLQDVLENGADDVGTTDGDALMALQDGGHPEAAERATRGAAQEDESDDDDESVIEGALGPGKRPQALGDAAASSTALVPVEEDEDTKLENLRSERRASRWFSQDIFKGVASGGKKESRLASRRGAGSDDEESGEDTAMIREFEDEELPSLPLTDKEKRRLKRKREQEKLEKLGKKRKVDPDDNKPMEVAPLEAPRPLVTEDGTVGMGGKQRPQKPTDPQELAETLALGSLLVNSKKSRMDIIDAAYNRWSFDRDETLPEWFTEDENKHNTPELPISKELMREFRQKLREINARPIRKVTEAKARKSRRLQKRLEKLRTTAMGLAENGEMSATAKARMMRKQVSKMAKQEQKKPTVVAMKKGGGGNKTSKGKVPKGAKTKVVDRRMKSDTRGEKKAQKKNPKKYSKMLERKGSKSNKAKNRRVREAKAGQGKKQSSGDK